MDGPRHTLGRATDTAALGDGDEGAKEVEIEHQLLIVDHDH